MTSNGQTSWRIKGEEVISCNCDWGCPCQFNANPTHGNCHALAAYAVTSGKFGDVSLDGVRWAMFVSWPGAIHEGDGTAQLVIDESANPEQRDAIQQLASGEQGGAYFEIFASVLPHVRDPLVAPVEIQTDRERRVASVRVGEIAESNIGPITNPVTGDELRARIDLPDGFEYTLAEVANVKSGSVSGDAPLDFTLENTYAQLNQMDWNNS